MTYGTSQGVVSAVDGDKYNIIDEEGGVTAAVLASINTRHQVSIAPGYWYNRLGSFVRMFPKGEIQNLSQLRDRLSLTMDLSSFVINLLKISYAHAEIVTRTDVSRQKHNLSGSQTLPAPQDRESIILAAFEEQEEMPSDERIMLDSIGGLENVKEVFREIIDFSRDPDSATEYGAKRPQSVLLYGPTGTGKTMLATAFANELGAELRIISPDEIYHKWYGESEAYIRGIFQDAVTDAEEGPIVLCFDELDGIISIPDAPHSGGGSAVESRVAAIFKQVLNTITQENPNLYIIATTNDKDRIDPALIRSGRFDYQLYVAPPNEAERHQIFVKCIESAIKRATGKGNNVFDAELDLLSAAKNTDGLTGSNIDAIIDRLLLSKAREKRKTGTKTPITNADLTHAIEFFNRNG